MLIKIVGVQTQMGDRLSLEEKIHILKHRPDFVCLPEYCLIDSTIQDFSDAAKHREEHLTYFKKLSVELATCLIAGSVVESENGNLYNTSYIIDRGLILGRYRKRKPVPGEIAKGIAPGSHNLVLDIDDVRIGVLICGDVFASELYDELGAEGVDIIFVPTTSPFRPDDSLSQKQDRDQTYFVAGAERSCSFVVKVCGVGHIFGKPLQGRSLVAAPWGVITQIPTVDEQKKRLIEVTLDTKEIREFRGKFHDIEPENPGN
jgi:omega-amidase